MHFEDSHEGKIPLKSLDSFSCNNIDPENNLAPVCYSGPAMQCKEEEPYKEPIPILWITLATTKTFTEN